MNERVKPNEESSAVQTHVSMIQDVIQRMAENSRSCKVWCVTLVAAVLVLAARTEQPQHTLIALVPTFLFLFLDSYYLALERAFIKSQNTFVDKLHKDEIKRNDFYRIGPMDMGWRLVLRCMFDSLSILPFYLLVAATIFVAWLLIIPAQPMNAP